MNTPVARKLAAADARRVAAARAARAAAASKRAAAAKRRMLTLSIFGAVTISAWILTGMVSFPWIISAVFTAATVGLVELGRRAAAAGVKADAALAERVRQAEANAPVAKADPVQKKDAPAPADLAESVATPTDTSSLRVEVNPEEDSSWTPVPVPPPAYTLKAEVRRKEAEPYQAGEVAQAEQDQKVEQAPVEAPASEKKVPGSVPSMPQAPAASEPAATDEEEAPSVNVQEILARRRAVG